jgi:hypothetical protein
LEVEKVPELVNYLRKIELISAINRIFQLNYNQTINSFDDVFVVKYQTQGDNVKSELTEHTDAGDFSFMIALSDNETDYSGGGTYFRTTDSVLQLSQGSLVTFDASLFHRGEKITSGTRYLLVGFCHTDPVHVEGQLIGCDKPVIRGNLSKELNLMY